ncbi:MAG TPA: glycosyltransferase [Gammaproteobacteria bacterium]|nr:glycosyltransferase [Gammaproteobacteria bacterium]
MNIVILGLSITSSWGNGHATTYRGLVRELTRQGHEVLFLERDTPWYAAQRDLPEPPFGETRLYDSVDILKRDFADVIHAADAVIVGSYVPEGIAVADWVLDEANGSVAFYDIDTPVTLAKLAAGDYEYLEPDLIPRFNLYLSFTGGPLLTRLEEQYGARRARPLYCSVDPEIHYPKPQVAHWDLGYLGTYSPDRQPRLERLLLQPARRAPARRFVVAGAKFPSAVAWPPNVEYVEHVAPAGHCAFYNAQRFTLNVTRDAMIATGYAPSVRLFEAAACGVPVISDRWDGLETLFEPEREILIADDADTVLGYLDGLSEAARAAIGQRARRRVMAAHTASHRARELVEHLHASLPRRRLVRASMQ